MRRSGLAIERRPPFEHYCGGLPFPSISLAPHQPADALQELCEPQRARCAGVSHRGLRRRFPHLNLRGSAVSNDAELHYETGRNPRFGNWVQVLWSHDLLLLEGTGIQVDDDDSHVLTAVRYGIPQRVEKAGEVTSFGRSSAARGAGAAAPFGCPSRGAGATASSDRPSAATTSRAAPPTQGLFALPFSSA